MSHFGVIVLIDLPESLTEATVQAGVERALERYQEHKYDWYQIGGRWTGHFDGYDPDNDPHTHELCEVCGGTGNRSKWRHELPEQPGCNGCKGTGIAQQWPTKWPFRSGDCKPAALLTEKDLDIYAVVADGDGWFGGERWEPWHGDIESRFVREPLPPLDYLLKAHGDKLAVIVDCHN